MTADQIYLTSYARGWTPDPVLTVSQWADEHRRLSPTSSSEAGMYRTSRTPYLREIMDVLSATHPARRVVFMKGSQIGATEAINNAIGYVIHHAPGPTMFVEPTVDIAKAESKQRIAPMIEASDVLHDLVKDARSRDSGNTILMKEFPGGVLVITGANSAKPLRRMPVRYLFLDEVDGYPGDVDGEGDPVRLAEQRTTNFPRRKVFLVSTPTVKGVSRIEREFQLSDQRRYFVPCPHCGHMDWIRWENLRFAEGKPETARLVCIACQQLIDERHKTKMLAAGEWRPTAEGGGRTIGYHLSALYSPLGWKSWADCVAQFLEAKEDPLQLKTWVNTVLGETWEERGESVEASTVFARREKFSAEVPVGVGLLVAAVDVQGDRLEAQVKGYGAGEESWLIAFTQIAGDPSQNQVWLELDQFLTQEFTHASGRKVTVECTTVDSGGHHTEEVYRYCQTRFQGGRRVFAVKGGTERGKPLVPPRPTTRNAYHARLYTLCVDTGKQTVTSRLRVSSPGPGFMHLPDWVDEEYCEQLTAEKAIWKWVKNRGRVRDWIKVRERNEALDLEVYSLAALHILGQGWIRTLPERAAELARGPGAVPAEAAAPTKAAPPRRRGWVNSWKG